MPGAAAAAAAASVFNFLEGGGEAAFEDLAFFPELAILWLEARATMQKVWGCKAEKLE